MQSSSSSSFRRRWLARILGVCTLSTALVAVGPNGSQPAQAKISWIGYINHYRRASGLPAVKHEYRWDLGTYSHSCYMTANGPTHVQVPGRPGYTLVGKKAGAASNVGGAYRATGSPTADMAKPIDDWMSGPFHAIGILRPGLRRTSLGLCYRKNSYYATLDVTRGLAAAPPRMVVFPGNGATVKMNAYQGNEQPNPTKSCPVSSQKWGLPLIAMFPKAVSNGKARLNGPTRNWREPELCVLDHNDVNDPTAKSILKGANAVIVMAPATLPDGNYKARVWDDASGQAIDWWFKVDVP